MDSMTTPPVVVLCCTTLLSPLVCYWINRLAQQHLNGLATCQIRLERATIHLQLKTRNASQFAEREITIPFQGLQQELSKYLIQAMANLHDQQTAFRYKAKNIMARYIYNVENIFSTFYDYNYQAAIKDTADDIKICCNFSIQAPLGRVPYL